MAKFKTTVEGTRHQVPKTLGATITPEAIEDVPVSVRHKIKNAYKIGVSKSQLLELYQYPEEWIDIFIAPEDQPN